MNISLPHDRKKFFQTSHYWEAVKFFFHTELKNDGEDITAQFCVEAEKECVASIIAKSEGVLAGQEELNFFLQNFFPTLQTTWERGESEKIFPEQKIITFTGNARKILQLERIFLNTLSRMSGIATMTHKISQLASPIQIAATRKTQWSYLDKKSVSIGGGLTHRMGLFDSVLVKENHQIIANYNENFFSQKQYEIVQRYADEKKFFEVEVETPEEFHKIFTKFCDEKFFPQQLQKVIMLDNFTPEKIFYLLQNFPKREYRHAKNIFLEASGGITEKNISQYSKSGVDVISLGALTHSVLPLDFSLRVQP